MRAAKPEPWLVYDGKLAELYRIFIPTLLLSIVTLGIYRFWGKTRIRRYLWAHTSFQGDRFVYTGTGGELFRGFLFATLLLFGLGLLNVLFSLILLASYPKLRPVTGVPFLIVILILADAARFSAQRYRLSRTTWRGIRGGMHGSALRYGLHALGMRALTAVTLFQYLPWAQVNLAWDRINASSFGDVPFWFEGSGRRLYGRWVLTCLGWIGLLALFAGTLFACSRVFPHPLHPQDQPALIAVIALVALIAVLGAMRLNSWFTTSLARYVAAQTSLGHVYARTNFSADALFWFRLGNFLITVFTLGVGIPIVIHRRARFLAGAISVEGVIDPATLGQNADTAPRFGEGLLMQLDGGAIF